MMYLVSFFADNLTDIMSAHGILSFYGTLWAVNLTAKGTRKSRSSKGSNGSKGTRKSIGSKDS